VDPQNKKPDAKQPDEKGAPALLTPGLRNPGLVFLFIALPVLFFVLYFFVIPEAPLIPRPQVAPVRTAEVEKPEPPRYLAPEQYGDANAPNAAAPGAVEGTPGSGGTTATPPQASAPSSCDFDMYVGQKISPLIQGAIKAAGKAVRVLPPGAMMTMDYSTDRVNFDVDAQGIITRVWCG
jgi:hypothetical protein